MRLFAGFPISPDAVERLSAFRLRIAVPNDGLRWSIPEQWHITLRFFGEVHEAEASALAQAFGKLRTGSISLSIETFGVFEVKGILFADVVCTEELLALYAQVQELAAACGVLPETRPFRPHITLARSKNRNGIAAVRRLTRPTLPAFGPPLRWLANEFLIYQSVLDVEGARYSPFARIPLRQ